MILLMAYEHFAAVVRMRNVSDLLELLFDAKLDSKHKRIFITKAYFYFLIYKNCISIAKRLC